MEDWLTHGKRPTMSPDTSRIDQFISALENFPIGSLKIRYNPFAGIQNTAIGIHNKAIGNQNTAIGIQNTAGDGFAVCPREQDTPRYRLISIPKQRWYCSQVRRRPDAPAYELRPSNILVKKPFHCPYSYLASCLCFTSSSDWERHILAHFPATTHREAWSSREEPHYSLVS